MKNFTPFLVMLAVTLGWLVPAAQAQTCAPPTNVITRNITNTSAVVSFTPSATAASYTVRFYSIDSTAAGITNVNTTTSPVMLTGLVAGRWYRVSVQSNCAGGLTTASPWIGFLTTGSGSNPNTGCAAPTGLAIAGLTTTTASITFSGAAGAGSYRIVYYAWGDSINAVTQTVTSSPIGLSGLLPGTQYVVRVFSNCSGATSAPAGLTFRTPTVAVPCGAVTNVVVTATSATTAAVSFTSGANNTRFTVTYYVPNDSVRQVTSTASPITITGLVPGRTYTVQVRSLCGSGTAVTYTAGAPITYSFRGALASRAALGGGRLEVFPNPAQHAVSLVLPAVAGVTQARVVLLNGLGQQVRTIILPLAGTETRASFDLSGVASGLYTLRVMAGGQSASQQLAVE
ncbi:fibronectin type III domain-containing protein [Microvirga sp. STS02]|uniref:fibronectin type III domain-containing protein n=1 Tax=Hymenobacter negativus TaxID=2795026 RepID=UPI0018DB96DA|nr:MULTISPECIES: fibronectin type III domain-containing protein [Bacteria]MBH8569923.1 fibronectin type III domain-containing protein [Hymenobacter negativus]MBR7209662.1 fibronectin type III domain-containing protein [Microvirga sp. STS02]